MGCDSLTTEGEWKKAVGVCPRERVEVGGCAVEAMVDSGSQVTLVSEDFFREKLEKSLELETGDMGWFRLTAANGLNIPLLGCIQADVGIRDCVVRGAVLMVMRQENWTQPTPCLLGVNILNQCPFFQNTFPVPSTPNHPPNPSCNATTFKGPHGGEHRRVRSGRRPEMLPGSTLTKIRVSCAPSNYEGEVLIEPGNVTPIEGLLVVPTIATVNKGYANIAVLNVREEPCTIPPRTPLGISSQFVPVFTVEDSDAPRTQSASVGTTPAPRPQMEQFKKIGDTLSVEEREKLERLIKEFADVFAWSDDDLGFCELLLHRIFLTDARPRKQPYRRIPPALLEEVRKHIDDLLRRGIIRPSMSPYAAPIVVVRKKGGEIRLCCDYRALNDITRKDSFPLPRIDECLDALGGATVFSSLDAASGYHQLGVEEGDKEKTAFITPHGLYEWNRMPFGLCNAGATFQRLMQGVMHEQIFRILLVYLDDLLVYSKDFETHLASLRVVFELLRKVGIKLKPDKCSFAAHQLEFLGHTVSEEGIRTSVDKVMAVREFKRPETAKEVRRFLGMAGYYRRFIQNFAHITRPLNLLLTRVHERHKTQQRQDRHKGETRTLRR